MDKHYLLPKKIIISKTILHNKHLHVILVYRTYYFLDYNLTFHLLKQIDLGVFNLLLNHNQHIPLFIFTLFLASHALYHFFR